MHGRPVHELDVAAQTAAGEQAELALALEVEGGRVEGLVEIQAFRRNPGYVDQEHPRQPQTYKFY